MTDLSQFIPFAHRLADAAGDAIRPHFGDHGAVEAKHDQSPVTRADRAAEMAMRALIETHYPDHGIYGEELGQKVDGQRFVWAIDPIDGTRAFIAGGHAWGTLIALCDHGVPVLGVLDQPITGERWFGMTEQTTLLNGQPIKTRSCQSIDNTEISTTSVNHFDPVQAERYAALASQCGEAIAGGDCYAYGLLARGQRDIVADAGLKPYDILALVPIVEGAGGTLRAWDGAPITLAHHATALAVGDAALYASAAKALAS